MHASYIFKLLDATVHSRAREGSPTHPASSASSRHASPCSGSLPVAAAAATPLTVRPKLKLQKLVSKLALVPYVVTQVEIAGHRHLCPRKARRRTGRRASRRLAVTSVAQARTSQRARPFSLRRPERKAVWGAGVWWGRVATI